MKTTARIYPQLILKPSNVNPMTCLFPVMQRHAAQRILNARGVRKVDLVRGDYRVSDGPQDSNTLSNAPMFRCNIVAGTCECKTHAPKSTAFVAGCVHLLAAEMYAAYNAQQRDARRAARAMARANAS